MSATGYIDIKSRTGQLLASVIITQDAEVVEELMQSDYVELLWKSDASTPLPPGAYIEVGGERYRLLDGYTPDQTSEAYTYTPQFHSRVAAWSKVPFFFYTFNDANEVIAREPEWTLTDTPANFMSQIIRAIKIETGETWTAVIDSTLSGTQSVKFGATDIFSSLNSIAGTFNTEWRAEKTTNTLYLGKAMHSTAVTLTVGGNIQTPSVTNNRAGYYNRFYVFGSTRNVTQDYQGASVNNLVSKRLTLDPVKYPGGYIDIENNLQPSQVMQKILTFDDVYPRAHLELPETGLRARLMYRLDEGTGNPKVIGTTAAGDPIYDQYVIWYIRPVVSDTGIELSFNGNTYDPVECPDGMLIKGKTLSVHFNSGALTGREFELAYHDKNETLQNSDGTPFEVQAGDFEILFKEEGGLILPTGTESGIAPQAGDTLTLFNCRMPAEYTASAYIELEDAAEKEIAERYTADTNNYQFSSNPVAFKDADPGLTIGRAVHYVNGDYAYDTRVIKIVRKLDLPYEQTITVGNDRIKRNSETIKEEVTNANRNIDVLSALNNLTKNIQDSYGRAQQAMIEGFNRISRMWQFDPDDPQSIFSQYNVYSTKAIAGKGATAPGGSGGGGGSLFGLYTDTTWVSTPAEDDALSAVLGKSLHARVSVLEGAGYLTGITKQMVEAVLTGDITSHTHNLLSKPADNRSVATAPNDYNGKFFFTGMKRRDALNAPGSDTYVNGFGWRGWSDSSGGKAWEVFGDNADLYVRCGSTTAWEAWRKILTAGGTASQFLMADGSLTTKVTASNLTTLGWTSGAVDALRIPDMNLLAYWNGCHSGTLSNLQYCDRGRFGTMAVANAADYLARSGGSMTNTNLVNNLNAELLGGLNVDQVRSTAMRFFGWMQPTSTTNADLNLLTYGMARNYWGFNKWANAPSGMGYGAAITFSQYDYDNLYGQLAWDVNHYTADVTGKLFWRAYATASDGTNKWGGWRQIAFTDGTIANATNAVNADIAGKLRITNSTQENCLQFMQKGSNWNEWDAPSQTYYHVIKLNHGNGDTYYNRTLAFSFFDDRIYAGRMTSGNFKGWKTLAFLDDNVASASKLNDNTAFTAWGQTFFQNGVPKSISGELQHVTALRFDSGNALVEGLGNAWNLWSVNGFQFFPTMSATVSALSITANGRVGVNMYSPQYDFDVTGVIHASGEIFSDTAIGGKGMTSSSDIRLKHIIGDVELSFEAILNSPSKRFTWLGGTDKNERIGTTAQYWLPILPQVVYTSPDGYYAVDYGTLANAKADTIAHVVADLVERLNKLESQLNTRA